MKKSELKLLIKEALLKESGVTNTGNAIREDLTKFLTDVVMKKSRGYVNNERDAALLLFDILKHRYNI